jgi:hypothetical protein
MRTQLADPSYAAHARQAAAPSWFFEHSFGHRWNCLVLRSCLFGWSEEDFRAVVGVELGDDLSHPDLVSLSGL